MVRRRGFEKRGSGAALLFEKRATRCYPLFPPHPFESVTPPQLAISRIGVLHMNGVVAGAHVQKVLNQIIVLCVGVSLYYMSVCRAVCMNVCMYIYIIVYISVYIYIFKLALLGKYRDEMLQAASRSLLLIMDSINSCQTLGMARVPRLVH